MWESRSLIAVLCVFLIAVTASSSNYVHHVSIKLNDHHICSGSIINQRHILTAHSCILSAGAKDLTVVAGTKILGSGGYSYQIQDVITPEDFMDDIALLRTQSNIQYTINVNKIDVASRNHNRNGDEVTITSWEQPPSGYMLVDNYLQIFYHKYYNGHVCSQIFSKLYESRMCTVENMNRTLCDMDFGGAIVSNGVQIGINLKRYPCTSADIWKWHTAVYNYADWIKQNSQVKFQTDFGLKNGWHVKRNNEPTGINLAFKNVMDWMKEMLPSKKPDEVAWCNHMDLNVPIEKYPYHVSIMRNREHICSGSIINSRYILTSGLCVIDEEPKTLFIAAGAQKSLYSIIKVIISDNPTNMMALLRTAENIRFYRDVKPIAFAHNNHKVNVNDKVIFTTLDQSINEKLSVGMLREYQQVIVNTINCTSGGGSYLCTIDLCRNKNPTLDYGGALIHKGILIGVKLQLDESPNLPHLYQRIHYFANWVEIHSQTEKSQTITPIPEPDDKIQYPYHVSISRSIRHICSGSIINEFYVLTSFRCTQINAPWDATSELQVFVGSNSLWNTKKYYTVNEIIRSDDVVSDIALLRTNERISFNDNVRKIEISSHYNLPYSPMILTGWEQPVNGQQVNDKLQAISYNLCDRDETPFNEVYMCFSHNPFEFKTFCNLDYGGPLVAGGFQFAINPYKTQCDNYNGSRLVLPLRKHLNWIRKTMIN